MNSGLDKVEIKKAIKDEVEYHAWLLSVVWVTMGIFIWGIFPINLFFMSSPVFSETLPQTLEEMLVFHFEGWGIMIATVMCGLTFIRIFMGRLDSCP
jgi:hypothetical protein